MEDVDAPPLLSMKQAPGARVELPPFETAGPLLRLDEPELPVADADESEVPSAEAMVAQLKDLRAKLDDGIAFCANMATEKDNATRAVADARRELEQLRAAPPAGRDKAAAVAERGRRVPAVSDRARAATRLPPRQVRGGLRGRGPRSWRLRHRPARRRRRPRLPPRPREPPDTRARLGLPRREPALRQRDVDLRARRFVFRVVCSRPDGAPLRGCARWRAPMLNVN